MVAAFCARRDLDLDNVAAPIVTAAGDMVTLPSLFLATYLLGFQYVTPIIAIACAAIGIGAAVVGIGGKALPIMRRIIIESLPILALAGDRRHPGRHLDPQPLRVVPQVPGAARHGPRVPRGLRLARFDPRGAGVDQAPPGHAR